MPEKKIRVLIAKPGLDGHDRGARTIARALRDAGMEVVYTGLRQTPEMIASAAVQEDVDVIGLSILSGAHNTICPQLMKLLHEKGMNDVTVLVGGIIPEADIPALKQSGIAEIFLPGTSTQDIVDFIHKRVALSSFSRQNSNAEFTTITASLHLFVSADISAAARDASASIAPFVRAALRDRLSSAEIPARASVFADFQAARDRAFPHPALPAPRIPAPLHDGNRRIGTSPP